MHVCFSEALSFTPQNVPTSFVHTNPRRKRTQRRRHFSQMVEELGLANSTGAQTLRANQEKDGDSPIQHIIMCLKEKCRERITNGLRSFIVWDNYSAVEVGHLRGGQRPFKAVRRKMAGDCSEVLREGARDLTRRAEEFETLKACINVDQIYKKSWGPPLEDADWHAFCQAIYKGIKGSEWDEFYSHYGEMSKAAGAKKPSESQKSKSPVGHEGSQRQRWRNSTTQLAKVTFLGRKQTRLEL